MIGIKSGKGWKLPMWTVFDIYVIFIITSLAGLAISPIMNKLATIFPGCSHLEIQMIYLAPNLAAIPFVFIGGALAMKFNKIKLVFWSSLIYAVCGAAFFFIDPAWGSLGLWIMIILSLIIGIVAGVLSPVSTTIITDCFAGKVRQKQFGLTGAILNLVLMGSTVATGYLAVINWKLPFIFYLFPIIPLFLGWTLRKYLPEPTKKDDANDPLAVTKTDKKGEKKQKFSFRKECNVGSLFRYCAYYFFVTLVLSSISLYIPFLKGVTSHMAGILTAMLFLGIFCSGIILNWLIKVFHKGVFLWILGFMVAGWAMIVFLHDAFFIGLGVALGAFFYGIAQPYCYTLVSECATPRAVPMAQSFLISMNSIGVVLAPFIIDAIADICKRPTHTYTEMPFQIALVALAVAFIFVVIYKIWRRSHPAHVIDFSQVPPVNKPKVVQAAGLAHLHKAVADAQTRAAAEDAQPAKVVKPAPAAATTAPA